MLEQRTWKKENKSHVNNSGKYFCITLLVDSSVYQKSSTLPVHFNPVMMKNSLWLNTSTFSLPCLMWIISSFSCSTPSIKNISLFVLENLTQASSDKDKKWTDETKLMHLHQWILWYFQHNFNCLLLQTLANAWGLALWHRFYPSLIQYFKKLFNQVSSADRCSNYWQT